VSIGGSKVEVRSLEIGLILQRARDLGYLDEETNTLIDILCKREIIDLQRHVVREKPSQTVDLDAVAHSLGAFQNDLKILVEGFGKVGHLATLIQECEKYYQVLEEARHSGTPDPEQVHKLGRAVQTRHQELTNFANDKLAELRRRMNALKRGIRLPNARQLEVLGQRVNGSVEYTEQVNVLRNRLLSYANDVKSSVDRVLAQVDELQHKIEQEPMQYAVLAGVVGHLNDLETQIERANQGIDQFEEHFKHFQDWQRLVEIGSEISEQLQQMGHRTAAQSEAFADLSRSIRGEISSKSNKLESLPNHAIYGPRLRELREQIAKIRRDAEDEFVSLQNRYYQAFISRQLYRREGIESPFQYNVINPNESYRLLYDRIRKITREVCEQIRRRAQTECQDIQALLYSQSFRELPEDDRNQRLSRANVVH
jgi:hypothetical protein